MKSMPILVCVQVAQAFGAVTNYGIGQSGLTALAEPTGPLYSNLVIYPAVILMGCFGFWIVFSATDTSEK
jgi:hypothetical protein